MKYLIQHIKNSSIARIAGMCLVALLLASATTTDARAASVCPAGFVEVRIESKVYCTHGSDPAPEGGDIIEDRQPESSVVLDAADGKQTQPTGWSLIWRVAEDMLAGVIPFLFGGSLLA